METGIQRLSPRRGERGERRVRSSPTTRGRAFGHLFDRLFALLLLLPAAPLMVLISLLILVTDGRPILYGGERLGRDKEPFRMLKFRTLRLGAERVTGARVIVSAGRLAIPLGRFLRETRLDELPQLVNVLRGEMAFVGPRPVRPSVYKATCRNIPGDDRRFRVRPGMIGISQLYTPSATHKRYRVLLDNQWIAQGHSMLSSAMLIPVTTWYVLKTTLAGTLETARARRSSPGRNRRRQRRVLVRGGNKMEDPWRLVDANERAMKLHCEHDSVLPREIELVVELPGRGGRLRRRSARCRIRPFVARPAGEERAGREVVVAYRPVSARSQYVVHQYVLGQSLARPVKRRLQRASVRRTTAAEPARRQAIGQQVLGRI